MLTDVYFHLGPSEGWGLVTNLRTRPIINQAFYQAQELHRWNPHHLGNLSLVGTQNKHTVNQSVINTVVWKNEVLSEPVEETGLESKKPETQKLRTKV